MSSIYVYDAKKRKKSSLKIIIPIISVGLVAALIFGAWVYFFAEKPLNLEMTFPGSKTSDLSFSSEKYAKDLKDSFSKILLINGLAVQSFKIENKIKNTKATYSQYINFSDQIEILEFYAEQNEKVKFRDLNENLISKFYSDKGFFIKRIMTDSLKKPEGSLEISISEQIRFCKVLMEGYQRFGDSKLLTQSKNLSNNIYPLCKTSKVLPPEISIAVPKAESIPDFSATPMPKPSVIPTIDPKTITYIGVLDLSTIDLYAIKTLAKLDSKWNEIYTNSLSIVENSLIEGDVPLFNAGYDISAKTYIPFLSKNPEFDFDSQLRIALRLAEVSKLNEKTFSYLKQLLFNTKTYYETYQVLSQNPVTDSESITSYAQMARIARILNDKELYDLCISSLRWNTATNKDSKIFALPFRTYEDNNIFAFSVDSILMLKSIF